VTAALADDPGLSLPGWLDKEMPCLAAPLLDARGDRIGLVALISRRRAAYTVEDRVFLRTVLGHAALAINNATMYESIEALSRIDALTGLHNRREFDRLLALEISRARESGERLSLIVADIDHFKQINDQFGHQQGDLTLQQVARVIQLVPKRVTDGAFRIGGEEFAILMVSTDKPRAIELSESLRRVTGRGKFLDGGRPVTLSLGVATFPDDALDASSLISAADKALYRAKSTGRNRVQAA
jgi:diguanylate cyclase (GGDEF)-like protein